MDNHLVGRKSNLQHLHGEKYYHPRHVIDCYFRMMGSQGSKEAIFLSCLCHFVIDRIEYRKLIFKVIQGSSSKKCL